MSALTVALIFDDQTRPETTGVYCRWALAELATVRHFQPDEVERVPRQGFDLYLRIDDGLRYHLPADLHPQAWWAIDTHMDFAWSLTVARGADFVFAAQRDGAEQLQRQGVAAAEWLPLGCDPAIHRQHALPKSVDVCFVGNVFDGPRAQLLALLQRHFCSNFVGRCYFEEMARAYSAARVVFNRSIRNDVNMRVFEALACGSLLITNDLADNGQAELFRDGVHLATYREAEELLDKVRFYLARDELRERIAQAGRAEVLARHTYRHRLEALLQRVAAAPHTVAAEQPARTEAGPARVQPAAVAAQPQGPPAPGVTTASSAAPVVADARDSYYFEFDRPELVALVPTEARTILDIGCGAGRLGQTLKARQPAAVTGIEFNPRAAKVAEGRLDQVFCGDVERLDLPFGPATFDAVVCGDVLEHLRAPEALLRRIRGWLKPAGCLVASIPNVRHFTVINSLLAGNWTYEAAGLLDNTHLHFFTRRSIEELFDQAGFRIRPLQVVPGPGYEEWNQQGRPDSIQLGRLHLQGLPREEIEEFFVYQYLVTAEPMPAPRADAELGQSTLVPREQGGHHQPAASTGPQLVTGKSAVSRGGPMRFTQDFRRDFEQFDFFGPPFAFARFADGERAVCLGQRLVVARDGWVFPGGDTPLSRTLNEALRFTAPDYYLGLSDGCCDRESRDWYLQQIRVPLEQVTFSNIFVNANYQRFRQLDLRGAAVVSCGQGDFRVPENLFAGQFDLDALVEQLLRVDRPILVAAGPASAVIIHKYWQRATRKQVIVDVGSAIDEWTKGYKTRPYHYPGTRTAELVCRW